MNLFYFIYGRSPIHIANNHIFLCPFSTSFPNYFPFILLWFCEQHRSMLSEYQCTMDSRFLGWLEVDLSNFDFTMWVSIVLHNRGGNGVEGVEHYREVQVTLLLESKSSSNLFYDLANILKNLDVSTPLIIQRLI